LPRPAAGPADPGLTSALLLRAVSGPGLGATRGRDDGLRAAVETAIRVLQEALGKTTT